MHPHIESVRQPYALLSKGEALFVECVFSRLLPERESESWFSSPRGAEFVDDRLQSGTDCVLQLEVDLGIGEVRLTGAQVARAYRSGIAAVQRHCRACYGEAFQALPSPRQHLVLGLLERGAPSAGLCGHAVLFSLLVQHAAEAYFDATHIALMRTKRG